MSVISATHTGNHRFIKRIAQINQTIRHRHGIPASVFLFLFILFAFPGHLTLSAQSRDTTPDTIINLKSGFVKMSAATRIIAEKELLERKSGYAEHQALMQQSRHFDLVKNELEKARGFLKKGYGNDDIYLEINQMNNWRKTAGEGVITNKDEFQTVRNLSTTSILLNEILNRTLNRLEQVHKYHQSLGQVQHKLDSLMMDKILYHVPADSVSLTNYFQTFKLLMKDLEPVNVSLRKALDTVQKIEIRVNMIRFSLESDISETESQRKELFQRIGIIESGTFIHGVTNNRTLGHVFSYSLRKAWMVLVFYVFNHISSLLFMFLFIIGISLYLKMLERKYHNDKNSEYIHIDKYVLSNPFSSSTVLVLTIYQLFLPLPPFVFSGLLWIISGIAVSMFIRKEVPPFWYKAWLVFFTLFLFGFCGNLLLRQSINERYTMLVFIITSFGMGVFFLFNAKKHELHERKLLFVISLMLLFETLALVNFFASGFNQAKTFMTTGVFTVVIAYFLYWSARSGKNLVLLSRHFRKNPDDDFNVPSGEKSAKKTPLYTYLLFFMAWFILISRNFYFYQTMFDPLGEALIATRTIGAFTFTYKSIFVFFLVLVLSGVISQVVSFLASDNTIVTGRSKQGGLGSWMLLIRIAIITAGVLLAFVSAGIAMDKFAIILGALSVGIGFGLQTLINNLVSGLIIAFEKPINVGDIVEISGQTGRMKSIGIRSSVITTWDGANVIIPNGDLLNQHLINWTLGSSKRRFDLPVGVAYGTDLEKAKTLLLELMESEKRILRYPEPFILITEFSNSSVDLCLKFWVPHFSIGFDVKSDLIVAVDKLFRENGIVIPFPQQDVHISSTENPSEKDSD